MALVGQIPVEINNSPVVSIVKFDAKNSKQTNNRYGAYGFIGASRGQAHGSWNATLAVPKTGSEVAWDAIDTEDGFTITYSEGSNRYMLLYCHLNDDGISNDPDAGSSDKSVSGTYGKRVQIS